MPARRVQLATAPGSSYLLARANDNVKFETEVNHEVRVTGKTDKPASPSIPDQKMDEKDMAKLTATIVSDVADRCMATVSTGTDSAPATK